MIRKLLIGFAGLLSLLLMAGCSVGAAPDAFASSDVVGAVLKNRAGDQIGTVEDVMVDMEDGRITYLIVEMSPDGYSYTKAAFVPGAELRTAVPLAAVEVDTQSKGLVLNIEQALLDDAPLFAANEGAEVWEPGLHDYWLDRID